VRWIIAALTAAAALVAAFNEVASLDRFASEKLHFPEGLSWSLPGMVTIATLAGALMWTVLREPALRSAGKRLNLACACISAAAVGLDHASGAKDWWIVPAGMVGALVPALATWLTHLLARMTEIASDTSTMQLHIETPVGVVGSPPPTPTGTTTDEKDEEEETVGEHVARRHLEAVPASTTAEEDLESKARKLVAEGAGRGRLETELGIGTSLARRWAREFKPEPIRA
jgi:hypothetical protein